jgi:HK97 family phage major capsid protein
MATGITERERALREEMAQVHDKMRVVMEKFDRGEELTVEDRTAFDQANGRMDVLQGDLTRHLDWRKAEEAKDNSAVQRGISRDNADAGPDKAYRKAYLRYMAAGLDSLSREERVMLERAKNGDIELAGYKRQDDLWADETREVALGTPAGAGVDGAAGYLIPQGFWMNLQIALKAYGGLMDYLNILDTATGQPLPWPTTDPTGQLGYYLTENTQATDSSTIKFGQGMLHAWTIVTGPILASLQIINDSAFDVDGFVTDRMAERLGRKIAAEIHTGAGAASSALTGVSPSLVAWAQTNTGGATPAQGGYYKPSAGDLVNTLNNYANPPTQHALTAGIPSWTSLINMIGTVDPAYRQSGRCVFVMNDQTQQGIRTISDGFGHPLWQPAVQVGPAQGPVAQIEGFPVVIDQNSPNISTSASTAGGILFGDFKTSMVMRRVNQAGTMRLTERYADFLQVGYIGYMRLDLMPNDLRAVAQYVSPAS